MAVVAGPVQASTSAHSYAVEASTPAIPHLMRAQHAYLPALGPLASAHTAELRAARGNDWQRRCSDPAGWGRRPASVAKGHCGGDTSGGAAFAPRDMTGTPAF